MNSRFTKVLPLSIICGSIFFSPLFADESTDSTDNTDTTTAPSTMMQQITPPAGFASMPGVGFSITADFIYWEARQANLDFAQSGSTNLENNPGQGQVYYPSFKYKPGFKVGAAVDVGHDNWDLSSEYTWLNGSGGKSSTNSTYSATTLTPTRTIYNSSTNYETTHRLIEADGNWNFHYNLINLVLGRDYYISQHLTLRPYFGLAGAWNNQSTLVHYTLSKEDGTGRFISQSYGQRYWGVGFDTGLNTSWCFDDNWSIYGDFCFMNLWSRYKDTSKQTAYAQTDLVVDYTNPTVDYNTQAVQYGIQNVIDIQMGLRWGMRFDDNNMGISFQAGWDQQVWINQSQNATGASNLSLQGLDIKARFDF